MQKIDDQTFLRTEQYHTASNLNARISLHQRFSRNRYGLPRWLFDHVNSSSCDIFEVGCGSGNFWNENRDRIPAHWRVTLCDFSPGMVRQAQQNLTNNGLAAHYLVADAQALPLADASFDTVFAHFMLYHVPNRRQTLGELRRLLKPGGRLYAATNGQEHLGELFDLATQFNPTFNGWRSTASEAFTLENGAEQLEDHFGQVKLIRYDDELLITDPAAVVSYIASFAAIDEAQQREFLAFVTDALAERDGTLRVTKASGVFVAM